MVFSAFNVTPHKFPIFQHFLLTRLEKSDTMNQGIALITDLVLSDGF